MTTALEIQRSEQGHRGAWFSEENGERIAEMTFTRVNPSLVIIDHTEVAESLKGQGAARQLLDAAVKWARDNNTKFIPVCPYAKAQFDKDPSIRDVLSIVDVANAQLEVFRAPRAGAWTEHFTLTATQSIRPVSFPEVEFPLKDFLVALPSH